MNASSIAALPRSLKTLLHHFYPCFYSVGSYENFVGLIVGLLLTVGRHTLSNVLRVLGPEAWDKHHSALYDFVAKASWKPDFVSEQLFLLCVPWLPEVVHVLLDDTLCKKSGPHIWGGGMHHDAVRSSYGRFGAAARKVAFAFGHNFVVVALWVRYPWSRHAGVAIPVLFRLHRTKKTAPEGEYKKRTELAAELVHIIQGWCLEHEVEKPIVVLADQEYVCGPVLNELPKGVNLIGAFSMKAALYEPAPGPLPGKRGRKRKKGERLPTPKELAQDPSIPWKKVQVWIYGKQTTIQVKVLNCLWYGVTKTKLVRVVITRDPSGRLDDRAYLCTAPSWPPTCILIRYSRRWPLECCFRTVKQYLGLEDPQNGWWRTAHGEEREEKRAGPNAKGERGRLAAERTVPMIFLAYALVHIWYFRVADPAVEVADARQRAPWYTHKSIPSFADMLRSLRMEILRGRILGDPVLERVREKVAKVAEGLLWAA